MDTRHAMPNQETLDLLRAVSTATLTTQLFKRGLRNTFHYGLRPLNTDASSFVGPAFTLRYIPAREDLDVLDAFQDYDHPQRRAIESVPPGHVLVMDCRREARAASAGEILVTRLMRRGVAGLVTDGSLRDSPEIAKLPFSCFAAGASAMTNLAMHHAVDLQVPIGCAGVPVYPGDLMVADAEGVVCVPADIAVPVARAAAEQEQLEAYIRSRIDDGDALRGVYPPDSATLEDYRRSQDRADRPDGDRVI